MESKSTGALEELFGVVASLPDVLTGGSRESRDAVVKLRRWRAGVKGKPGSSKEELMSGLSRLGDSRSALARLFLLLAAFDATVAAEPASAAAGAAVPASVPAVPVSDAAAAAGAAGPSSLLVEACEVLGRSLPIDTVSVAHAEVCALARLATEEASRSAATAHGALPALLRVVDMCQRVDGEHALSPAHTDALQLCLLAKQYRVGARLVERGVTDVGTGSTATDLLRFLYYGGRCLCGLGRLEDASELYKSCVSLPVRAASRVQLCALQQLWFCALIVTGQPPQLPRYVSQATETAFVGSVRAGAGASAPPSSQPQQFQPQQPQPQQPQPQQPQSQLGDGLPLPPLAPEGAPSASGVHRTMEPYVRLAREFKQGPHAALVAAVDEFAVQLGQDGTLGLAKQLAPAFARQKVDALRKTYVTLPVGDVARLAGLPAGEDVERLLADTLAGAPALSIELAGGMVRFPERSLPQGYGRQLEEQSRKLELLLADLSAMDAQVAQTQDHVAFYSVSKRDVVGGFDARMDFL
jgi:hypothetical protein